MNQNFVVLYSTFTFLTLFLNISDNYEKKLLEILFQSWLTYNKRAFLWWTKGKVPYPSNTISDPQARPHDDVRAHSQPPYPNRDGGSEVCVLHPDRPPHPLGECRAFTHMSPDQRREVVEKHRRCYVCLRDHYFSHCRLNQTCGICGKRYHTLLHRDRRQSNPQYSGNRKEYWSDRSSRYHRPSHNPAQAPGEWPNLPSQQEPA